jgi:hypothetical protein
LSKSQTQTSKTNSNPPLNTTKSTNSENKKEITEDEIKTKMVNFYKSFFIKNEDEDDPYSDEEGKTPG